MIRIISIHDSPRLQYTLKIVFETLIGCGYELVIAENEAEAHGLTVPGNPVLYYGFRSDSQICVPAESLLFENTIEKKDILITDNENCCGIYFGGKNFSGYSFDFDIFAAVFYLVTQYEDQANPITDSHSRYDENAENPLLKTWRHKPLADIYARLIWQKIKMAWPALECKQPRFDYKITFDVDSPWLYQNKGLALTMATLAKSALKLDFASVIWQLKVLLDTANDPYNAFAFIAKSAPKNKLAFFFLIDRHSPNDGRHTYKNKAYRKLIRHIAGWGIETGIHPSYTSSDKEGCIAYETKKLAEIAGKKVHAARMHFLRYKLPDTFNQMITSGITNDYTLCPITYTGFKTYISRPYKWFDLNQNIETNLILHPTMVMDRSMQKYMKLGPEAAFEEIKRTINATLQYNGVFTILFHNSTLSEISEWKGWKEVYIKTLEYLSAKKQEG